MKEMNRTNAMSLFHLFRVQHHIYLPASVWLCSLEMLYMRLTPALFNHQWQEPRCEAIVSPLGNICIQIYTSSTRNGIFYQQCHICNFLDCQGAAQHSAQWKHSCFPPCSPGFKSWLRQYFFSLLLSLWTVVRSNPSSAKQWISQMQLEVMSRAKYYKKLSGLLYLVTKRRLFLRACLTIWHLNVNL